MHWIQNIKSEKHSYLIVWILGIFLLVGAFVNEPKRVGDAHEYVLMQESLLQHGSVDLRLSDLIGFEDIAKRNNAFSLDGITSLMENDIRNAKSISLGYVKSYTGKYYSFHFFLYSLLSLPVRVVLDLFNINPLKSFQLLNSAFVFMIIAYIYFFSLLTSYEKHWLSALYLLCGTSYYLFWIHPEIVTGSLFLLAIIALYEERYLLAVFCSAVASTQNPPVVLFVIAAATLYIVLLIYGMYKKSIKIDRDRIVYSVLLVMSGFIVLFPSLFYSCVLQHPNPIVLSGWVDYKYISLSRFLSLWFDINQGVILGDFGIYLGIIFSVLFTIPRSADKRSLTKNDALFIVFVFVFSAVMSMPCLITVNWNAGLSTYIRYGYWLVQLVLFGFFIMSKIFVPNIRGVLMISIIVIQILIVGMNKVWGNDVPPGRFTGISKSIMYRYPEVYNPVPEIFADRAYGAEHPIDPNRIYAFERKGKVTKLLINNKNTNAAELIDGAVKYKPIAKISRYNVDDNWYYLNGRFKKEIITTIIYDEKALYDSNKINWTGWSVPEDGFRWSDGNKAMMEFKVDHNSKKNGRLLLTIGPFKEKVQHVKIELNGELLFDDVLTEEMVLEFPLGNNDVFLDEKNTITYQLPNAAKPISGGDNRMLGIFFKWMEFVD